MTVASKPVEFRVLGRDLAQELSAEEIGVVSGGECSTTVTVTRKPSGTDAEARVSCTWK